MEQRACACPGGTSGVQVCSVDGKSLSACSACPDDDGGAPDSPADLAIGDASSTSDIDMAGVDLLSSPDLAGCAPKSCSEQLKDCGTTTDGCGHSLGCGNCPAPLICGAAGPNVCGCASCAALGRNCGSIDDGCGHILPCGTCPLGQTCGGGGTTSVCGCMPSATCGARNCGVIFDGCMGQMTCGPGCTGSDTCGGGGVANVCGHCASACTAPQSCGGGGLANTCGGCSAYGAYFTAPAAGAPGGQKIFDSAGYLYYPSFHGGLCRVPPGGGTIEVLVSLTSAGGLAGMSGSVYVAGDHAVLYEGVGNVFSYDPTPKSSTSFATLGGLAVGAFGLGVLSDSAGHVIALRQDVAFNSNGSSAGPLSFAGDYMVFSDRWVYVMSATRNTVWRMCFDGSGASAYGTGFGDGYGLALGSDGSLYFGQGNTNPATIYKVPPGGGTVIPLTQVPMAVLAVAADPNASAIYVSGTGDENTVWRIDTTSGAKMVYGCDPNSARHCGATN
jgi:hypothetical protein